MMKQYKTALFDFDGVIVDTEPIYDVFWNDAEERYGLGIPGFAGLIKGVTLPDIMEIYFSGFSEAVRQKVYREVTEFQNEKMSFPPVPGSLEFLRILKEEGVQTGLVTSSDEGKMKYAFQCVDIEGLFDIVITADRITKGKPNPMCYLLAASCLQVSPGECLVFEDSFAGVQAGNAAGMRVIALSTTNPRESLLDKAYEVIPNFSGLTFKDYLKW
jgi:HAD superfamily hydrolase (TIGR01509 family)